MTVWFVPRDAAARSMGADAVASALEARGETVVRNGSRGLLWMEPLVERAEERHGAPQRAQPMAPSTTGRGCHCEQRFHRAPQAHWPRHRHPWSAPRRPGAQTKPS